MAPVNHDYLPNLANIWPALQDPWYDPGALYTVASVVASFGSAGAPTCSTSMSPACPIPGRPSGIRRPRNRGLPRSVPGGPRDLALPRWGEGSEQPLRRGVECGGGRPQVPHQGQRRPGETTRDTLGSAKGPSGSSIRSPGTRSTRRTRCRRARILDPPVRLAAAATDGAVGGTVSSDFWMVNRTAKNPVLAHTFINFVLGKSKPSSGTV